MSDQYDHEDAELTGQLGSSNAPCDPKLLTIVQIGPPHLKSIQVLCYSGAVHTTTDFFFKIVFPLKTEYLSIVSYFVFKTMQK